MRRLARHAFACLAVALAGCQSAPPNTPEAALCQYTDKRPKDELIGHDLKTGAYVQAEIDPATFRQWSDTVWSVMAKPKNDLFRKEYRTDCYDQAGKYWYPCMKTVQKDFSDIRGIGRALDQRRARQIALRLCEFLTHRRAPKAGGVDVEDSRLDCEISYETACPLPEPPAKQN